MQKKNDIIFLHHFIHFFLFFLTDVGKKKQLSKRKQGKQVNPISAGIAIKLMQLSAGISKTPQCESYCRQSTNHYFNSMKLVMNWQHVT